MNLPLNTDPKIEMEGAYMHAIHGKRNRKSYFTASEMLNIKKS
jgi:hypothetical protein